MRESLLASDRIDGWDQNWRWACERSSIEKETPKKDDSSATILTSIFCMTNNMLGAGMLTLPYALYRGSMMFGLMLLVFISGLSLYSVLLLAKCSDMTGKFSYKAIAIEAFGPKWGGIIELLVCVLTFFSCVAYSTLVGDFVPRAAIALQPAAIPGHLFSNILLALQNRRTVIIMCIAMVDFPLCLLRDLRSLRFSSALAVCCILFAGGVVINYAAVGDGPRLEPAELPQELEFDAGAAISASLMSVAFTLHYNALRFYHELSSRSIPRIAVAAGAAHTVCLALYAAVGVAGYTTFGSLLGGWFTCDGLGPSFSDVSECQLATNCTGGCAWDTRRHCGDILNCYPPQPEGALLAAARLALAVCVALTLPLPFHAFRAALQKLCLGSEEEGLRGRATWAAVTGGLLAVVTLVALLFQDVDVVLAYKGSLLGSWVVFILPPAFYLALLRRRSQPAADASAAVGDNCTAARDCLGGGAGGGGRGGTAGGKEPEGEGTAVAWRRDGTDEGSSGDCGGDVVAPLFGGRWLPRAVMGYGAAYGLLGAATTTFVRLGYQI